MEPLCFPVKANLHKVAGEKREKTMHDILPCVIIITVLNVLIVIQACGALGKKNRIVGGTPTYVHQYPWMAMLTYKGKFYCGATVINHKYVMTAAHCVHG